MAAAALTPRGKALRRLSTHRGITEDPHGSNTDRRPNRQRYGDGRWGIRKAQEALASWLIGTPWCGTWCAWALGAAGVVGVSWRQASVSLIEDDARAKIDPFWDWQPPSGWRKVLRGDLVVLFGRGVHVEMVRSFKTERGQVYVVTEGGNTSSGTAGSQSNGGGSYRRVRPLSQVHGFARVDYPGGAVKRRLDRLAMAAEAGRAAVEDPTSGQERDMPSSDLILMDRLAGSPAPSAKVLSDAMQEAMF